MNPAFISSNSLEGKCLSLKTLNQIVVLRQQQKQLLLLLSSLTCAAPSLLSTVWEKRKLSSLAAFVTLRKHVLTGNHGVLKHLGSKGRKAHPDVRSLFALYL